MPLKKIIPSGKVKNSPITTIIDQSKSDEAKERLMPTLDKGNIDKSMNAPYVVIIIYDTEFYESLSILSPHNNAKAGFIGKENKIKNGTDKASVK